MKPALSLVIPVYNELSNLSELYERCKNAMDSVQLSYEVIVTDNCSTDGTRDQLEAISKADPRWKAVFLSRNFGHQNSLLCGLKYARGEAVISIDGDLQDPPEFIPKLVARWKLGTEVVSTTRLVRPGEPWLRMSLIHLYYRILTTLSRGAIPANSGDFRLMGRRALNCLLEMNDQRPFFRGQLHLIGFKQELLPYQREVRFAGQSKMNFFRLLSFGLDGLTSTSLLPLRLATYVGFFSFVTSAVYLLFVLYWYFTTTKNFIAGWTTVIVLLTFYGSAILMTLGIIGEYIGRIFEETKRRPHFYVDRVVGQFSEQIEAVHAPSAQF
jgi:glycosyltransferase involved in cell wall biosynthesis